MVSRHFEKVDDHKVPLDDLECSAIIDTNANLSNVQVNVGTSILNLI